MGPVGLKRAPTVSAEYFISWACKLARRRDLGLIIGDGKCPGLIADVAWLKGSWQSKFGKDWVALVVIHSLELSVSLLSTTLEMDSS